MDSHRTLKTPPPATTELNRGSSERFLKRGLPWPHRIIQVAAPTAIERMVRGNRISIKHDVLKEHETDESP